MSSNPDHAPAPVLGLIGLGTVGTNLAERAVAAGLRVRALVRNQFAVEQVAARFADAPSGALTVSADPQVLAGADIVIEALPERLAAKTDALRAAGRVVGPEVVLATTATALPVSEIAAASGRPDRVAGFHPVPGIGKSWLVELVPSAMTGPTVLSDLERLARLLGGETVRVGDHPGRVSARLLYGFLNGAAALCGQGYVPNESLDTAMRLGCALPSGPLAFIDAIGVDTLHDALTELAARTGDRWYEPAPVLRRMVHAGRLGRKTGGGFFEYEQAETATIVAQRDGSGEPSAVRHVAVVGSGTMAAGIAEVCIRGGLRTTLIARSADKAARARTAVAASLMKASLRGKIPAGAGRAALALLDTAVGLAGARDADIVIEAVAEDLEAKRAIFEELGRVCRPDAVLTTSTSSLPVTQLALASGRPEKVVGMHFFNPAPVMRLVEIVRTAKTGQDALRTVQALAKQLGKTGVLCEDQPGFIVNALLFPYLNQAVELLSTHYADVEQIDGVLRDGCGFPMGPFALLDVVGLDVSVQIQQVLHEASPRERAQPAALLTHLVRAGLTGRKSGAGFRAHAPAEPEAAERDREAEVRRWEELEWEAEAPVDVDEEALRVGL
jgi:3-hydroxybutyryl-CoA dehydrogenase